VLGLLLLLITSPINTGDSGPLAVFVMVQSPADGQKIRETAIAGVTYAFPFTPIAPIEFAGSHRLNISVKGCLVRGWFEVEYGLCVDMEFIDPAGRKLRDATAESRSIHGLLRSVGSFARSLETQK
jgi:hypothetical protein